MTLQIRLVIFDLDGTLLDTAPDIMQCSNLTLQQMGLPPISSDQILRAIGAPVDVYPRLILGDQAQRMEEYRTIFRPIYLENCLQQTRPFPGIVALLQRLRPMKLAVASNKKLYATEYMLEELNLREYFDLVVGPESVKNSKPEPDMIYFACEKLDISPKHTLMVGDTDNDVLAANSAKAHSCFVNWGYAHNKEEMQKIAHFSVERAEEILKLVQRANLRSKLIF